MQRVIFRAEIFKEADLYVAVCPELNVSSFGENIEEARQSVREAVEAFLEECERMGTLDEVLEESGFVLKEGEWVRVSPWLKKDWWSPRAKAEGQVIDLDSRESCQGMRGGCGAPERSEYPDHHRGHRGLYLG